MKFFVKASVALEGNFEKRDATLVFTSPDLTTGALAWISIFKAASVNTGSGMKDGKLKSKDFFDVDKIWLITFHSKSVKQTSHNTFDVRATLRFAASPSPRP